jgi:response regulator RpfG family c-di-GMP phosphodiesterase
VALPVAAAQSERPSEPPAGTETVLVVEDDDAVRMFTEAVLKAAGYEVLSASNGAEALEVARSSPKAIHLLMSDVVMPVLGGHALAEQMRTLHPEAAALPGYRPRQSTARNCHPRPTSCKAVSPAALCRKIRGILDN